MENGHFIRQSGFDFMANRIIVRNRKARFHYEILETFEAGIALQGTEVKSIRQGKVKITEAFCRISETKQMDVCQMEVGVYRYGNIHNHKTDRDRKLLMHRRQIVRLFSKIREKGLTLIPLSLYFKRDRVKMEIALCRGKKVYDKRASLKERETELEIKRSLKDL